MQYSYTANQGYLTSGIARRRRRPCNTVIQLIVKGVSRAAYRDGVGDQEPLHALEIEHNGQDLEKGHRRQDGEVVQEVAVRRGAAPPQRDGSPDAKAEVRGAPEGVPEGALQGISEDQSKHQRQPVSHTGTEGPHLVTTR